MVRSQDLFCPQGKVCVSLSCCTEITTLLQRNQMPMHSFRQAVCGYSGSTTKVCCSRGCRSSTYTTQRAPSRPRANILCGRSLVRSNIKTVGTYPFLARIGFINTLTGETRYPCSGVIINDLTVLTTATCALTTLENYKLNSVLIGEYDTAANPDCNHLFCGHPAQKYNISYVVKHPNFYARNYENNMALIRLKTPIEFSVTAQPICLPASQDYLTDRTGVLVGWGKMSDQRAKSSVQQAVEMFFLPSRDCVNRASAGMRIELCAQGRQEPCSGFSGSPLMQRYGDTYLLVGILSFGFECDSTSLSPSIFVNIQQNIRWITENA